jgi:hypothetical protein
VRNSSQHQSFSEFYTQFTTTPAAEFIPATAKNIHIAINRLFPAFPQHFGLYFHNYISTVLQDISGAIFSGATE